MVIVVAVLMLLSVGAVVYALTGQRAADSARRDLEHLANHDLLTGLGNRSGLESVLRQILTARGPNGRAAVIVLELDRFASVNDTYGHDVGDQLLVAAARQIESVLQPDESLCRLGGPQFVVLAPAAFTREAATARAEQFQSAIRVQYRIDHDHVRITATAGIVLLDQRHDSVDTVIDDANAALRDGNRHGVGTIAVFEVAMRGKVSVFDAEARMRSALERDEFTLHYMPVVRLDDSRIVGVEALLRWIDPERGLVAPGEFLGLLEQTDLLAPVGDWILREACVHNRSWHERFPGIDIVTTINVSPGQLDDLNFIPRVIRTIEETGADPSRLCLEITEGGMHNHVEMTWRSLRLAKEAGLQLALDDFGTGYSTFDYVRKFDLDILKIDQVFVERINESSRDFAIVQQLIGMAHALDFVAIAEGVDHAEQAVALSGLNCDLAQGYYWSQPQPLESIEKLIQRATIRPSANRAKKIDWTAPATPTP